MLAEVRLEHEQLFFERILSFHPILVLDRLLPHSHELPFLKLLEEILFLDVIVRISFNQPLTKRQELNWSIVFIKSETFATQSVVFLRVPILIRANLKIIRISIWVWVKIYEDGLFLTFTVEEKFNVFI
jgi:hypothetical protein